MSTPSARASHSVHRTPDPRSAHLLADLLRAAGIEARVEGQERVPLRGAVPSAETWLDIVVLRAEDLERARDVVREHDRRAGEPAWLCERCGEECPPTFDSCWSCRSTRPATPRRVDDPVPYRAGPAPQAEARDDGQATAALTRRRRLLALAFLAVLEAGLFLLLL